MKLSIITINLNNKDGLISTIESVINQTIKVQFEFIVVDGGSTDGSKEIIEKYKDKIDIFISEKDTGIYNAMNKGVRLSSGQYLQFVNSGDCLINDKIIEEIFPFLDMNYDIISGFSTRLNKKGKIIREIYGSPKYITISSLLRAPLSHVSSFIKKNLLIKRPYDENYKIISDYKFFLECTLFDNINYKHIEKDIAVFDNNGISSTNDIMNQQELKQLMNNLLPYSMLNDIKSIPPEIYYIFRQIPTSFKFQKISIKILNILFKIYCMFFKLNQ